MEKYDYSYSYFWTLLVKKYPISENTDRYFKFKYINIALLIEKKLYEKI